MRILPFLFTVLVIMIACSQEEKGILIQANLVDDFSSLELVFYEDSSFLQRSNSFTEQEIENSGTYTIKGKEIWLHGELDKEITPDILYINDDKLMIRNDIKGKLDTTFASFYRIKTNTIRSAQ